VLASRKRRPITQRPAVNVPRSTTQTMLAMLVAICRRRRPLAQLGRPQVLRVPVASEVGSKVATEYGLAMTQPQSSVDKQLELADDNGDDSYQLPAASTFVIGPEGRDRFASVSITAAGGLVSGKCPRS
jgi:hypothetical protein